ncbi:MAG: hypothetical protein EKK55_09915 [Rhodocyclaceae bacterium]|nr:MAG: hypothetical protein EKK55_09915 [Rhodocyclaceae bacterium]
MTDLHPITRLFGEAGWTMPPTPQVAHLVAYGQTLASVQSLPGVRVQAEASADGISPIHLCLGLFERFGVQHVALTLTLQPGAQAMVWAHGLFATPCVPRSG